MCDPDYVDAGGVGAAAPASLGYESEEESELSFAVSRQVKEALSKDFL